MADIERDALIAEIEQLRSRLSELPGKTRELEEKLLAAKGQLSQSEMQRDRLTSAVRDLRDQVETLRQEVSVLSQPPSNYGVLLDSNDDGTYDISNRHRLGKGEKTLVQEMYLGIKAMIAAEKEL